MRPIVRIVLVVCLWMIGVHLRAKESAELTLTVRPALDPFLLNEETQETYDFELVERTKDATFIARGLTPGKYMMMFVPGTFGLNRMVLWWEEIELKKGANVRNIDIPARLLRLVLQTPGGWPERKLIVRLKGRGKGNHYDAHAPIAVANGQGEGKFAFLRVGNYVVHVLDGTRRPDGELVVLAEADLTITEQDIRAERREVQLGLLQ